MLDWTGLFSLNDKIRKAQNFNRQKETNNHSQCENSTHCLENYKFFFNNFAEWFHSRTYATFLFLSDACLCRPKLTYFVGEA